MNSKLFIFPEILSKYFADLQMQDFPVTAVEKTNAKN